jgi:hypothetical protein
VAAVLIEFFNDDPNCKHPGWAWPSLARIADETGLWRRRVSEAIDCLVQQNYFERASGDRVRTSRYRPNWDRAKTNEPRAAFSLRAHSSAKLGRISAEARADSRPVANLGARPTHSPDARATARGRNSLSSGRGKGKTPGRAAAALDAILAGIEDDAE